MTRAADLSLPAVALVGAGPGHPDYLTLRGLRFLEAAEVILVDALLESGFQALFPARAEVVFVGKRAGRHSVDQDAIHALLLDRARSGRRVVRLKGGDPLVFGRGGEEALALAAAGIPFEIVPGVSAAQAAAVAAGVPLTHRGVSRSLSLVEGHHPEEAAVLAPQLAAGGTVALYMGTRTLARVATFLGATGLPGDLPLVLVESALRPGQVVTRSTLREAARGYLVPRTDGPGLVLLGRALAEAFPGSLPFSLPTSIPTAV